ncbi:hypothetical protein C2E23DRAFT_427610 [Lenzites betulinus]|nr:hypothetical protein C2E23DRAFT_427610 [Lenzites betulinus]
MVHSRAKPRRCCNPEDTLQQGFLADFPWDEYARAAHLFLVGLGMGVDVDVWKRDRVGVGHSKDVTAMFLSQTYQPPHPYIATIHVELMLLPPADKFPTNSRHPILGTAEKERLAEPQGGVCPVLVQAVVEGVESAGSVLIRRAWPAYASDRRVPGQDGGCEAYLPKDA